MNVYNEWNRHQSSSSSSTQWWGSHSPLSTQAAPHHTTPHHSLPLPLNDPHCRLQHFTFGSGTAASINHCTTHPTNVWQNDKYVHMKDATSGRAFQAQMKNQASSPGFLIKAHVIKTWWVKWWTSEAASLYLYWRQYISSPVLSPHHPLSLVSI